MSETIRSAIRAPRQILQPERNACLSCIATNILFSHGLVDVDWEVDDTDKLVDREKQELVESNNFDLLLLERGFKIVFFTHYNVDRFIEEGINYLIEYYGDTWPEPDFSAYWTPEKLAERIAVRQEEKNRYEPYNNQITHVSRRPTIPDVLHYVEDGQQVVLRLEGSSSSVAHAVLLYGLESDCFMTYYPNFEDGGIGYTTQEDLENSWLPDEGLIAVSLR